MPSLFVASSHVSSRSGRWQERTHRRVRHAAAAGLSLYLTHTSVTTRHLIPPRGNTVQIRVCAAPSAILDVLAASSPKGAAHTLLPRQIADRDTLDAHRCRETRARVLPPATMAAALAECGATTVLSRKLPALVTLVFWIATHLYAADDRAHVVRRLVAGLRWCWPAPTGLHASTGALCQSRYRLGTRLLARLFRRVCRPLATATTPGAFLFGLRLLALDGTTLDLADTPANVRVFGRQPGPRGTSAWPRVQVVALSECALAADEVTTHQRPAIPLRSRKPVGVIQEVYALLLARYLVRAVMVQAARTVDRAPTRLRFLGTLRLVRDALPDFQRAAPREQPRLYRQLLADVVATRLPARANRSNPRVVKQKMRNFRVKTTPHHDWPQPTTPFRAAIVLLIETVLPLAGVRPLTVTLVYSQTEVMAATWR